MPVDDWRRPGPTARQRRTDLYVALAAVVAAVCNVALVRSAHFSPFDRTPDALAHYGWAVAITVPLIWRRTRPVTVTLVMATLFIAGQVVETQEPQIASVALFAAIFALGAWGQDRELVRWVRVAVIGSMFLWLGISITLHWSELIATAPPAAANPITAVVAAVLNSVLTNVLMFGFFAFFGEIAWLAARRQHQLEEQTAELRAAQARAADRAVVGERVRIARELHDVVAHHVSVMGIQASAARRALDKDAGKTRTALAAVEQSARTAVDELRRMLGALRDSPEPAGSYSAAGLDRVEDLVTRVREAGLAADYGVYGDQVPVPDSVSQASYRIVQEALTNTLKHAHATAVDVRIRYLARELEIDVTDDGRGGTGGGTGGMGLIGMRERAAVHEGTVEAGPRPGGGFRVRARLPLELAVPA